MNDSIKQTIIDKFYTLTNQLGIKRVTIDMLARECGISKKTIYVYFKNKNEIVRCTTDNVFGDLKKTILELHDSDKSSLEKLNTFFKINFNLFGNASEALLYDIQRYYPEIQQDLDRIADEFSNIFKDSFEDGIKTGIFKDVNPAFVAAFLAGAAGTVLSPDFMFRNSLTVDESLATFKELVLSGILA